MEKEFNLSEKIFEIHCPTNIIPEEICKGHKLLHEQHVKEFIKRLKKSFDGGSGKYFLRSNLKKEIDKLAGEKFA